MYLIMPRLNPRSYRGGFNRMDAGYTGSVSETQEDVFVLEQKSS